MTIYARKEICGCKPGEKVEVYGTYIEDGCIMFVVWAKSLKIWAQSLWMALSGGRWYLIMISDQ